MRLEDITPGSRIRGLDGPGVAEVIGVRWIGGDAIEVVCRSNGAARPRMVFRDEAGAFDLVEEGATYGFQGDGARFRLAAEAWRIRLAHLFDPFLAVHTSRIEPLPHQLTAVYGELLPRQPLRYLLADDPGAGKTIMAGLFVKELLIRGDLERCLIVAPGSLVEQWQDELSEKFDLAFDILTRDQIESAVSGNPFIERNRLILRLDMAARSAELQGKIEAAPEWDLVIVDEAHRMAASYFGGEVKYTKRYQFGKMLGRRCRNLMLMSATPHNGKEQDFQLFLALLDEDRFEGRFREGVRRSDVSDLLRRMTKEELVRFDGTPLFPERRAYTVKYKLSPAEAALYEAVTAYVREEMNRADAIADGDNRRQSVGFALQILQRRLASSSAAIHESLRRRLDRLQHRLDEERLMGRGRDARLAAVPIKLPDDEDEDLEEAPGDEAEAAEEAIVDQATASRTIAELEAEIATLRRLEAQAAALRRSGEDTKWRELAAILDDPRLRDPRTGAGRKLLIFTEPRDTLAYLAERIRDQLGSHDAVAELHGGIPRDRRRAVIAAFNDDPEVRVLLANDAAGEGVNLQRGAHLMVNYDLPWNPNRLEQRFGRIHRIGQTEVCHLWNLVAHETREGAVLARLLEKVEEARKALGGKVYDVLGELFESRALRELLVEAIRYGEQPGVRARLFVRIDGAIDEAQIRALVAERKLAPEGMTAADVATVRAEMERAEARRLQPRFVRAFFADAFEGLGGAMRAREPGRFEITHVPGSLRDRDFLIGRGDPVLTRYARVCFDKARIPGQPQAAMLAPGHPLLDATVDAVLERDRETLRQGAVLVDDGDDGEALRVLAVLSHGIRDGTLTRAGAARTISECLQFVFIDEGGRVREGGPAPHLDLRPATAEERGLVESRLREPWLSRDLEARAMAFAVEHLVPQHLAEVRARRLKLVEKTEAEVKARLAREISWWDNRAHELALEERAGKTRTLNAEIARRRAEELSTRMQRRLASLAREREVAALAPHLEGAAVVVPAGLLRRLAAPAAAATGFAEETTAVERAAMDAVMAAERALGREPRDVSDVKCGYDIESRDPRSGALVFIEVKGRRADADSVIVTKNEIMTALNKPDAFVLAIVRVQDGYAHEPRYVREPFQREPDFAATSVTYRLAELLARAQAPG
jgi:Superfamily II DNA/RNA helicases, SNF2 family